MFEKLFASAVQRDDPRYSANVGVVTLRPPVAGVRVDEETAQRYSAVFRATNVTATSIMTLPFRVNAMGSRAQAASHPASPLLTKLANPEMPARRFRRLLTGHAILWGNGYAEIERDRYGAPVALWPISPKRVTPRRDPNTQALYYEVRQPVGQPPVKLDPMDVFHLMGPSMDGINGLSRVALARETVSLGIAAEGFAAAFYGNGAWLGGIIKTAAGRKGLTETAIQNLLATFNRKHRGSHRARQVEYLDAGLEFEELAIPQKDAEFIQTRTMTLDDIARWFDVPPHKLMQMTRSIYNNIEAQEIAFVKDAVVPWAVAWEEECDFKILGGDDAVYSNMSVNGLMRGDMTMRAGFYNTMFNIGALSPNEIRDFEDLDPYDGGEYHYMQTALTTVEPDGRDAAPASQARAALPAPAAPAPAPAPADQPPGGQDDSGNSQDDAAKAQRAVLVETLRRFQTKERHAAERALKKAAGVAESKASWAAEFYATHARQLADALAASCQALTAVLRLPPAGTSVLAYAVDYGRRRAAYVATETAPVWETAEAEATLLIKRITGGH